MNNIPKLKFKYLTLEETIIKEIEQKLLRYLDNAQMEMLHRTLKSCLDNVTFIMQEIKEHEEEFISKCNNK